MKTKPISHQRPGEATPKLFGDKGNKFFEEDEELPQHVLDGIKQGQDDSLPAALLHLMSLKSE